MSAQPAAGNLDPGSARVRSFIRRGKRLKPRLEEVWDRRAPVVVDVPTATVTSVAVGARLDLARVFGREGRLVVEVGCGAGEQIAHRAAAEPDSLFLGLEVWHPGLVRTLARVQDAGLTNVRLLEVDAEQALPLLLPAGSVDELWTFFPDPWPKSKHHKRRLVAADFAGLVARLLAPGGTWRLATDWQHYADQMHAVLDADPRFSAVVEPRRWEGRVLTRFERRGMREGRAITDLTATRLADPPPGARGGTTGGGSEGPGTEPAAPAERGAGHG